MVPVRGHFGFYETGKIHGIPLRGHFGFSETGLIHGIPLWGHFGYFETSLDPWTVHYGGLWIL